MISDSALISRFRAMKLPTTSVSIQMLLNQVLPEGSFLVSGNAETRVSWARTITAQASSLSSAVQGDLVIVSVEDLKRKRDPERELARIIGNLIQARIQTLGIQGNISITALETAARNNMAVVYLPDEHPIERIERSVIRYIMDQQALIEKRDQDLQHELIRQASGNITLSSVVKILANAIDTPVILHDNYGMRLAHNLPDTVIDNHKRWQHHFAILSESNLALNLPSTNKYTQTGRSDLGILETDNMISVPMNVESEVAGYLSILKTTDSRLDDFISIALARVALVCGLVIGKQRLMDITDSRSRLDWIANWLNSHIPDDPMITARAEQDGFNFDQVYVILVMRWTTGDGSKRVQRLIRPEQLTDHVRSETQIRRMNAIVGQYVDRTVLFLPLEKAQHTNRMKINAISISDKMTELLGGKTYCGVGRPAVGLAALRRSLQEAEKALNLVEQIGGDTSVAFFGDLSLSELLIHVQDYEQLYRFCLDWLSDILNYDKQNNSDLLVTMSVYFSNNGNMAATAKQLNVHRNTLVYRLNRIAEITQLDMDDADVQLNLHLAIKAYNLLKKLGLD